MPEQARFLAWIGAGVISALILFAVCAGTIYGI